MQGRKGGCDLQAGGNDGRLIGVCVAGQALVELSYPPLVLWGNDAIRKQGLQVGMNIVACEDPQHVRNEMFRHFS